MLSTSNKLGSFLQVIYYIMSFLFVKPLRNKQETIKPILWQLSQRTTIYGCSNSIRATRGGGGGCLCIVNHMHVQKHLYLVPYRYNRGKSIKC